MSQAGIVNITGAGPGPIEIINGDTGFISGPMVTIYADNAALTSGSSVQFINSGTISTLNLTDVNANTILGFHAGTSAIVGQGNTGLGGEVLHSLVDGLNNVAIGYHALRTTASGSVNIAIGDEALLSLGTADYNIGIGSSTLGTLLTGTNNIAIGIFAGVNYTGAESSNILLGNEGVLGESNVIRIGTQGTSAGEQDTCFIAGIVGVTTSNTQYVTINSSTGQLGASSVIPANTLNITSVASGASPYTVLPADEFLAVQSAGGAITIKLPNAPTTGRVIYIKDSNGAAATSHISVTTVGGAVTIDGQTTYTISTNYQSISVVFDGTSYEVF